MLKIHTTLLFALCTLVVNGQNISTIAGGGPRNLQALQTGLCNPAGVAVDSSGNVYVSASSCNQIWKIDSGGQVNVFAGNGIAASFGDGGPAVNANIAGPHGLVFDTAGNLYVAESGLNRIRKISTTGVITTVAGSSTSGSTGDGGLATSARLNNPVALAFDSSMNLYIADKGNHKVRIVSAAGIISTFAGTGTASFGGDGSSAAAASLNAPTGVAVDSVGNVYIADSLNQRVRKVSSGIISTLAGDGTAGYLGEGGPASASRLNNPVNVAVDPYDLIYIVQSSAIRYVAGGVIYGYTGSSTSAGFVDGTGTTQARFNGLAAIAFSPNYQVMYFVDGNNNRIRLLSNLVDTFAGNGSQDYNGNGKAATDASVYYPIPLAVDNAGGLYFGDYGSTSIRKLTLSTGNLITYIGSGLVGNSLDGSASTGALSGAYGPIIFDKAGNTIIAEANRIRRISAGVYSSIANLSNIFGFSGDGGVATAAQFRTVSGLALAKNGDLYLADENNHRIRMINGQTGIVSTVVGNGTASSTGDGGPGINATVNSPFSLALDGKGNLFIGEKQGHRVRKLELNTNIISTVAGNGTYSNLLGDGGLATAASVSVPLGIFVDEVGNLFIANWGASRIRKVAVNTGIITTVAGNGNFNYSGDGGPATSASFAPLGLIIDRSQNLYISDASGRIRTTQVTACFLTFGTPNYTATSAGGTGSMTVTATDPSCAYNILSSLPFVTITSGASGTGGGTITFSIAANTGSARTATVQVGGASFTVTQAAANAQYNVGFFQPSGPQWVLDSNGNGVYDAADKLFAFAGQAGAIAVVGDWNGDGRSKVGYYLNGFWALDYNGNGIYDPGVDKFYAFGGGPGYIPVVGDWNGDGRTKVGYYHDGFWALDTNGNGTFDAGDGFFGYGGRGPAEVPIVGDWNGDHRSKIGFFFNGTWVLDYDGNGTFGAADKYYTNFTFVAGDKPVVGDWNGDGTSKIGIYRGGFWILDYNGNGSYDGIGAGADKFYGFGGNAGETPLVADWNGDGRSKIGVYLNGFWELDFNGNGSYDGTGVGGDRFLGYYGGAGSQPIIGRW